MVGLHEVKHLLKGKEYIWEHSLKVAEESIAIAQQYALQEKICIEAALCHDVGGMYTEDELLMMAIEEHMALDPAETQHPFLLHQRFSRKICEQVLAIKDERITEAVGCHTTLKANPSAYDMALFIADKLAGNPYGELPYAKEIRKALCCSLESACLAHIDYVCRHGMILMPHRWLLEARTWLIPFSISS